MNKYAALAIGILVAVFALDLGIQHFAGKHGEHVADLRTAHAEVVAKTLPVAKAETVFVHDTVRLRKTIVKYDSSSAAYKSARAAVNVEDTASVNATLAHADTAVANADTLRLRCDTTVKHAASVMYTQSDLDAAIKRENKSIAALIPGRTERAITAAKWIGLGVGLDRLVAVLLPHH